MNTQFSSYEKELYQKLFNLFQDGEHHVEFTEAEDRSNYSDIVAALKKLSSAGVLFILHEDSNSISVELTPDYCYELKEL